MIYELNLRGGIEVINVSICLEVFFGDFLRYVLIYFFFIFSVMFERGRICDMIFFLDVFFMIIFLDDI